MRTRAIIADVLLVLSVFLAVEGCSKRGSTGSIQQRQAQRAGAAAGGMASPAPGGQKGTGTVTLQPVKPKAAAGAVVSPAAANRTAAGNASPMEDTDRLLTLRGGSPVYPSDYQIGALQPVMATGTQQGAITQVVEKFFEALAAGHIDTALLAPEWKDELVRLLSAPQKSGDLPQSVRIGTLSIDQDQARAAIRMRKGSGSAEGQIYLDRVDGTWYVSDIQANFSELSKPAVRTTPFDPAEWKSMVKE